MHRAVAVLAAVALVAASATAQQLFVRTEVPLGSTQPLRVVAADVDGDGDLDLVAAGLAGGHGVTHVLANSGAGSFTDVAQLPTTGQAFSVAAADFDGDGDPDLAIGTGHPQFAVELFENQGGSWVAVNSLPAPSGEVTGVIARDLDGDGLPDLAVAEQGDLLRCVGSLVRVRTNTGNFQFTETGSYATGCQPFDLASGDFDGANGPDLATADRIAGTVSVFMNDGAGGFANSTSYVLDSYAAPYYVHAADLDADGLDDLAVSEVEQTRPFPVHVLWSTGSGFKFRKYGALSQVGPLGSGDFDGDGDADLVAAVEDTPFREAWFTVLRKRRGRSFSLGISRICGISPRGAVVADLDPTIPAADVAIAGFASNSIGVFLQTGAPWPRLELSSSRSGLFPFDSLTLTASNGAPSAPLVAAIVTLNGSPIFTPVALATFDAAGQWQLDSTAPAGLSGLHLELAVYGIEPSGRLSVSNWSELQFF